MSPIFSCPREILLHIFSYLEPKNLTTTSRVCKAFNKIIVDADQLWKPHCLSLLDRAKPSEISWKQFFKRTKNWVNGNVKVDRFEPDFNSNSPYDISLSALAFYNKEPVLSYYKNHEMVFYSFFSGKSTSSSFSDDKTIQPFYKSSNRQRIVCSNAEAFYFLDPNGLCTGKVGSPDIPFSYKIHVPLQESILFCYDTELKFWDLKKDIKTVDTKQHGQFQQAVATDNFCICSYYDSEKNESCILSINLQNYEVKQIARFAAKVRALTAKNSIAAVLTNALDIQIFKEQKDAFGLLGCINRGPPSENASYSINLVSNLLIFQVDRTLEFWNLKTLQILSSVTCPEEVFRYLVDINADTLFLQAKASKAFYSLNFGGEPKK